MAARRVVGKRRNGPNRDEVAKLHHGWEWFLASKGV